MLWGNLFSELEGELVSTMELLVMKNVFEAILECGHDEDFSPAETDEFGATDAPAGSRAKIDILAHRVLQGQPLWHPSDRSDYSGLTGAVRPRA
jgi:hypothetical protein